MRELGKEQDLYRNATRGNYKGALEYRGMSQREFARRMDYTLRNLLASLLTGKWSLLRIPHIGLRWF